MSSNWSLCFCVFFHLLLKTLLSNRAPQPQTTILFRYFPSKHAHTSDAVTYRILVVGTAA